MPTDYMEADEAQPTTANEGGEPSKDESYKDSDEEICLINKTFAPDAKVGDVISGKVVHVYEDELAMKPVSEKAEEAAEGDDMGEAPKTENAYME